MLFFNKPWIRIIYIIPEKTIKGPWIPFEQKKVDEAFSLMDGVAGNEIDYLHVNDSKGNAFIIAPGLAQNLIIKIETKNRLK